MAINPMWVMTGLQGISTVSSLLESGKADAQSEMALKLALEQLERFKQYYGPIETRLSADLQKPAEMQPGFNRMLSEVDRGYGDQAATLRRVMAGRYPAGSGLEASFQRSNEVNRGRARAKAVQEGEETLFQRRLQFLNAGRGIPQATLGTVTGLTEGRSNRAAAAADATGQGWGNLLTLWYLKGQGKGGLPKTETVSSGDDRWLTG